MNPISDVTKAVTSNISVAKVVGWLTLALLSFAAADALGITDWVLYPFSQAKMKFMPKSS